MSLIFTVHGLSASIVGYKRKMLSNIRYRITLSFLTWNILNLESLDADRRIWRGVYFRLCSPEADETSVVLDKSTGYLVSGRHIVLASFLLKFCILLVQENYCFREKLSQLLLEIKTAECIPLLIKKFKVDSLNMLNLTYFFLSPLSVHCCFTLCHTTLDDCQAVASVSYWGL